MRIAIMSPWNDCCGVTIHAELIGKAWLAQGHQLIVFAASDERVKGRIPCDTSDEPFVHRTWEMYRYGDQVEDEGPLDLVFNAQPFLEEDYDLFVAEKPSISPLGKLRKIFPQIQKKAKTLAVLHTGYVPKNRNFYAIDWDIYTLFDDRFHQLLGDVLPSKRTHIVPYPCHEVVEGKRDNARYILNLPIEEEVKIVLAYGIRLNLVDEVLPIIQQLRQRYDVRLLLLTGHKESLEAAKILTKHPFILFRRESPPTTRLYTYLHAADAILLHRSGASYLPTSSSVHHCLGALRPLLCPDNNFFEIFNREVFKYKSLDELAQQLATVFEAEAEVKEHLQAARDYVNRNSASNVAQMLIRLAEVA